MIEIKRTSVIVVPVLWCLAACHAAKVSHRASGADAAVDLRLDALEARMSVLERRVDNEVGSSDHVDASSDSRATNDLASADPMDNVAAGASFDDQDYQREILALCAARGVDCR